MDTLDELQEIIRDASKSSEEALFKLRDFMTKYKDLFTTTDEGVVITITTTSDAYIQYNDYVYCETDNISRAIEIRLYSMTPETFVKSVLRACKSKAAAFVSRSKTINELVKALEELE